jgi:hypothetical protein
MEPGVRRADQKLDKRFFYFLCLTDNVSPRHQRRPCGHLPIDFKCRDEIPQVLLHLQHIYCNRNFQEEVFKVLDSITPKDVAADKGRPGMDLWKILVLGTLRINCHWDYDKLHNIANEQKTIRKTFFLVGLLCEDYGITEWWQY